MDPVEVLIVGAGPTGLMLAAELLAHGVRPRVIDRMHDRVHESRALAIQPRTLEVLARLGLVDQFLAAGNRTVRLRLHTAAGAFPVALFDLGMADTAYPFLLMLSQAETERILSDHLAGAGVTVERGVTLVGLTVTDESASAVLRHDNGADERITVSYVVGCDGAHSAVREAAGIGFTGGSYPQSFVLADTEADGIEPGAAHAYLAGRGILFFFPLGRPVAWRLLAMRAPDQLVEPGATPTLAEVQALADSYTGGGVRLRDAEWLTNFRLHHRAATHYRRGVAFLAGDAAHIHSPAGGQGMNTGIQDAANLGWKLAHALRAGPGILATYEPERAPVGRAVVRFTDRLFRIATTDSPVLRFARTRVAPAVIPLVLRARRARGYAFRTVSQLGIRYRRSPLSVDGPNAPRRGPRAGDRLPDMPIVHKGQSATLHALVAGPGWHLLRFGPVPAEVPAGVGVFDLSASAAERRLGVRPGGEALFLVRPDAHIGYRSGPGGGDGLAQYCARWVADPART